MNHKDNRGEFSPESHDQQNQDADVTGVFGLNVTAQQFANELKASSIISPISSRPMKPAQKAFKILEEERAIEGTEHVIYSGAEVNNQINIDDDIDGMMARWNNLIGERNTAERNKDADYKAYLVEEQAERIRLNSRIYRKQAASENKIAAKVAEEVALSKREEALEIAIESRRPSQMPGAMRTSVSPQKPSLFASFKNSAANALNYIWEGRSIKERDAGIVAEFGVKTLLRNVATLFNPIPESMMVQENAQPKNYGKRAVRFAAMFAAGVAILSGGSKTGGKTQTVTFSSMASAKQDTARDVVTPKAVETPAIPSTPIEALPDAPKVAVARTAPSVRPMKTASKAKTTIARNAVESVKVDAAKTEGDKKLDLATAAMLTGSYRSSLIELENNLQRLAASNVPGPMAVNCTPDDLHMKHDLALNSLTIAKNAIDAASGKILVARTRIATASTKSQFVAAGEAVVAAGEAVNTVIQKRNEMFASYHQATADWNIRFVSGKFAAAQKKVGTNADVSVQTASGGSSKTAVKINLAEIRSLVDSLPQDPYQVIVPGRQFKPYQPAPLQAGQKYGTVDQSTLRYTLNGAESQKYHQETIKLDKLANDTAMSVYTSKPTVNENRVDVRNACIIEVLSQ